MKTTKLIALILCAVMVFSSSVVIFAEDGSKLEKTDITALGVNEAVKELRDSAVKSDYYRADEKVTVIIELEGDTLIDIAGEDIVEFAASANGEKAASAIQKSQEAMKKILAEKYDISFEGSVSFTASANAFTAVISYGDLNKIAKVSGVKNAFVSGTYEAPKSETADPKLVGVDDMLSAGAVNGSTYTGEGIVVAILDTGLVYDHEAFSAAPSNPEYSVNEMKRLIKGYGKELNSAGEAVVLSEKVIYAYDYIDGDSDVYPNENSGDHGTHVAGIIAGNNGKDFTGVAPDAQLMIMKVFSDNGGGALMYTLLAALEDAVLLGADVINMSLGSTAGFTSSADETINDVFDRVGDAGVVLCCAAGNEAQQADYITSSYYPYAATPDYGVVSSPSTYNSSFSVASAENIYLVVNYMDVGGEYKITYSDYSTIVPVSTIFDTEYEYKYCGLGTPSECKKLEGKVALISRGDITFQEKVDNAAAAGAVAVIIANTDNTTLYMSIDNADIPVISVTYNVGVVMQNAESKTVCFVSDPAVALNSNGGTMSSFSSWGCAPNLEIKPEITAPGGYIYSATFDNSYVLMSGTSMACPAMAGSAAVILQYLYKYSPNLNKVDAKNSVINRVMSTADILTDPDSETYYSPRRQGSGMVNIVDAITTRSYLTVDGGRPKANAGSSENGIFKYSFEVNNTTKNNQLYTLDTTVLTDTPASEGGSIISALMAIELEDDEYSISYSAKNGRIVDKLEKDGTISVAVPAKDKTTVTVTIKLDKITKSFLDKYFVNGTYIEGYTTLTPANDTELVLPFIGFYGDWASLSIFDGTIYDGDAYYYDSAMMVYNEYDDDGDGVIDSGAGYFLGYNMLTGEYSKDNIAYGVNYIYNMSGKNVLSYLSSDTGYLRNAEDVHYTITDEKGNVVAEYEDSGVDVRKLYYSTSYSFIISNYDVAGADGIYDSTTLPEGKYTYTISGTSGGGKEQSLSYDFYVDNTAPVLSGYGIDDDVYYFGATDETSLQGVNLVTILEYNGQNLLGLSVSEIVEYAVLLYKNGYISYNDALSILNSAPEYLGNEEAEDGTIYSYYDLSDYDTFAKLFNKIMAPVLYAQGVKLNADAVAVAAVDYALNMDGYYIVSVD